MRALRRLIGVPRWLVVDLPCRFYLSAEDRGSRPVWVYFVGWLAAIASCLVGGVVLGLTRGWGVLDGAFSGTRLGLVGVLAWVAYAVLFLLALWFRGQSPAAVLNRHAPVAAAGTRSARHGRQAKDVGWRAPGEPLVSRGWLVLVTSVTAVTGLVALWAHQQAVEEDAARALADQLAASAAEGVVPGAEATGTGGYWTLAHGSQLAAYVLIALTIASLVRYVLERRPKPSAGSTTSPGRR